MLGIHDNSKSILSDLVYSIQLAAKCSCSFINISTAGHAIIPLVFPMTNPTIKNAVKNSPILKFM